MRSTIAIVALAASSQALVARDSGCCFGITAYGGPAGPVGQLSDGQNRIGDKSLPLGKYCIDGNGGLTDGNGKGCLLTPPTTQWQCDAGAQPTSGFSIGCNGTISHNGDTDFFACPTGMSGGYNIYSKPLENEPNCQPIWLVADSCHKNCVKTSTITAPCTTTTPPPAPKATCPAMLSGKWEFPHLIVPINSADANKAYGTVYNGTASGTISSIFNFDIPQSYAGMTCSLEFLFPTQDQLETSAYEFSGAGTFEIAILAGAATRDTTYASAPQIQYSFGTFTLKPGTVTNLGACPNGCPAGKVVSFWMSPVGDSSLNYFQDFNPCPIGLYVTAS